MADPRSKVGVAPGSLGGIPDVGQAYPRNDSLMKTITIAGGLLATAALLTGCGLQSVVGPRNQDTVDYEVSDKVAALDLKLESGDADITGYDGATIKVSETLRWTDDKPQTRHAVEGDTLRLDHTCPKATWGSCSVDYKVQIPKNLKITTVAGSGNITLRALSGPLDLKTGSGDVDAADLAGKEVRAEAGSGNLTLKYTAAPSSVWMKAGSGDVSVSVPEESYNIQTKVGSGDVDLSVKNEAASPRAMTLTTGSGNIEVLPG
jgi:hypothetical protein